MRKEDAQLVVRIIAILGMVFSVIGAIVGILMMFVSPLAGAWMNRMGYGFGALVGGALIVVGLVALLFSIFGFIVGLHLYRFKEWARIVAIVLASLGILNGLITLPFGLIGIVLHGVVLYFLGFNEDVKKLFKK